MEQLKQDEFDMGGEENMILEDIANKVSQDHRHRPGGPLIALESVGVIADWLLLQLREEIEMKILKKSYLYDIIKREIWDSMTVKYKTIMVRWGRGGISCWYAVFS